ncbi:MAG: hypothetical protein ACXU82_03765 [Caulobacteraceae bacterium]
MLHILQEAAYAAGLVLIGAVIGAVGTIILAYSLLVKRVVG